ncbi:MAG: PfkB family carbohydrate kinase [Chloroflexota bacterium]
MVNLIGVGDNTVDTYIHMKTCFPGGNAVNVAVLAKRYGHSAAYLGWTGNDERGRLVLDSLKSEQVDISHCRIVDGVPTAFSEVSLVGGDRVFGRSESGACELIKLTDADFDYIKQFDVVHTSVFSYLEDQIVDLKSSSRRLSFDFSQHLDRPYLEKILPHVDIALISLADVSVGEQDSLMRQIVSMGPFLVLMTRGKEGAWVFDGRQVYHQPVIPVDAVDTLGAGDAFAARFLVEHASGVPIPQAMLKAAESASENCLHYGAYGYGIPCPGKEDDLT